MEKLHINYKELLKYRSITNKVLFAKKHSQDTYEIFLQAEPLVILCSFVSESSELWDKIKNYINKPIVYYDNRLVSHNLSDSTSWNDGTSSYLFKPNVGYKYIISSIITRFPKISKIAPDNYIYFKVFLSSDGETPVNIGDQPRINLTYTSLKDLLRKSNVPLNMTTDIVPDAFNEKMAEFSFNYADPYDLSGSPLILSGNLNEYIEIGINNNIPIKDNNGQPLNDECIIVVNSKKIIDFNYF